MDGAASGLARLYTALRDAPEGGNAGDEVNRPYRERFIKAMDEDLNTPAAIAVLFELTRETNRESNRQRRADYAAVLRELGAMIGLLQNNPDAHLKSEARSSNGNELSAEKIETMLEARQVARGERDFAAADRIRDELIQAGI